MKLKLIMLIIAILVLVSCNKVSDFDSCAAAGNPILESYPEQCIHNGITYTNEIIPDDNPNNIEEVFCGLIQVQCVAAPCYPVLTEFESKEEAENNNAMFIQEGPCPTKENCDEKGGVWERAGLAGMLRCTIPYEDAGQPCETSDDCLGECIRYDQNQEFRCKENNNPFGCYQTAEEPYFICVD